MFTPIGIVMMLCSIFKITHAVHFLKLVSFGSGFVLAGIAFLIGPVNYIKGLFHKEKIHITIASYLITTILGIYASIFGIGLRFSLFVGFLQFLSMGWFIYSVYPEIKRMARKYRNRTNTWYTFTFEFLFNKKKRLLFR